MRFEKTKGNYYKIRLSQQEIDRAAKIIAEFSLIEEKLKETIKHINILHKELSNLTQMFLH